MDRTGARVAAMKLVYAWELGGEGGDETLEGLMEISPGENEADFMEHVFSGVVENSADLDAAIAEYVTGWKMDRLRRVDLCILRIAAYELMYDKREAKIVINEAVEIAREYSTPEAGPFVNGVLGALVRDKGIA